MSTSKFMSGQIDCTEQCIYTPRVTRFGGNPEPIMIIGIGVEHGAGGCRLAGCRQRPRSFLSCLKLPAKGNSGLEPNVAMFECVAWKSLAQWSYGLHGSGSNTMLARPRNSHSGMAMLGVWPFPILQGLQKRSNRITFFCFTQRQPSRE